MSLQITWQDIVLRLLLTVLGGALIGINREERGQAAGLRTTLLVCLAASLSMIQVNLLLGVVGKTSSSYIVMDLMRLPLGILSGMGFIGGGVILRKGSMIRGVTTAATLWFVTVMGLCFGGGQIGLGLIALALGMIILIGLKYLEKFLKQDHQATLLIVAGAKRISETEITQTILAAGFKIASASVVLGENATLLEMSCELNWRERLTNDIVPAKFLSELTHRFETTKLDWRHEDRTAV